MLVFGTTFASFSEVLFFGPHSEFDTLISKDSVPIIILRASVLIFNVAHHIPFVHHFPPFTIHIGYIILPYSFRFPRGVIIHNIINTIYKFFENMY